MSIEQIRIRLQMEVLRDLVAKSPVVKQLMECAPSPWTCNFAETLINLTSAVSAENTCRHWYTTVQGCAWSCMQACAMLCFVIGTAAQEAYLQLVYQVDSPGMQFMMCITDMSSIAGMLLL